MGLRLSDLPPALQAKYAEQWGVEVKGAPTTLQWHVEVTLGSGNNTKVMKSPVSEDKQYVENAVKGYIRQYGGRNIKIVESVKVSL